MTKFVVNLTIVEIAVILEALKVMAIPADSHPAEHRAQETLIRRLASIAGKSDEIHPWL